MPRRKALPFSTRRRPALPSPLRDTSRPSRPSRLANRPFSSLSCGRWFCCVPIPSPRDQKRLTSRISVRTPSDKPPNVHKRAAKRAHASDEFRETRCRNFDRFDALVDILFRTCACSLAACFCLLKLSKTSNFSNFSNFSVFLRLSGFLRGF